MPPNNPFKIGCKIRLPTNWYKSNIEGILVATYMENESDRRYCIKITKPKKKAGTIFVVMHSAFSNFDIIELAKESRDDAIDVR